MDDANKSSGFFWRLSAGAVPAGVVAGILWAATLRPHESDWFGAMYVFAAGGCALIGGGVSVVFSILSYAIREGGRRRSLAMAVPAGMVLALIGLSLLEGHLRRARYRAEINEAEALAAQIHADPAIVIRERWHQAGAAKWSAMSRSLSDPQTPYTLEMIKAIYEDAPVMRSSLFAHPAVDPDFIRQRFDEAIQRGAKTGYTMLATMVAHPNCPIEFVEQVAASDTLPVGAVFPARKALKERGGRVYPTY